MKKLVCVLVCAGFMCSALATESRVISMGRHDAFFLDVVSIYRNPANINLFPNMLIGEMGEYTQEDITSDTSTFRDRPFNENPKRPYFGGILSYSLNQSAETGNQYPLVSLGVAFNRHDDMLSHVRLSDTDTNLVLGEPLGKVDLMVGYTLANGITVGAGTYLAKQSTKGFGLPESDASIYRGNIGVNVPLANTIDLQAAVNLTSLTAKAKDTSTSTWTTQELADGSLSFLFDIRVFSALTTLNGDLVPHLSVEQVKITENNTATTYTGGVGLNLNIDKGFFWTGIEGVYESEEDTTGVGARFSFGIERNMIWDWFVWRIGGVKKMLYVRGDPDKDYRFEENPEHDGTNDDLIGFGLGLNIDNRLRVDGVFAEDMFYTWTNLISRPHHHILSRISATYSF